MSGFNKAEEMLNAPIAPINDYLGYTESESKGGRAVELVSLDMLEEDIAQMERSPTRLSQEKIDVTTNNAIFETLHFVADKINSAKISRLFPGLDFNDIEKYDFSKTRVKIVTLNSEDFKQVVNKGDIMAEDTYVGGFTAYSEKSTDSYSFNKVIAVNTSEKALMVVNELPPFVINRLKTMGSWPRELSTQDEELILLNIEAVVVHELLHQLNIANELPSGLSEGITEWYKQQILRTNYPEKQLQKEIYVGYEIGVDGVDTLVRNLNKQGVDISTIDAAFIGGNVEAAKKILDALVQRYGPDNAERILEWGFKNDKEALTNILKFEHDFEVKQQEKRYDFPRS